MSAPDPKPAARIVATKEEWQAIIDLKDGPCRAGTGSHWVDYAHLVPRGQPHCGDDVPDNIIPLGHEAHMLWHDRGKGWEHVAHMIRASLTREEFGYVTDKKGWDWLDEHYPRGDTGPLCAKCRKPLKAEKSGELEKPRLRKQKTLTAPKGMAVTELEMDISFLPEEDRKDVLSAFDALLNACGEELARARGGNRRSAILELFDVMHFFLTTPKEAA